MQLNKRQLKCVIRKVIRESYGRPWPVPGNGDHDLEDDAATGAGTYMVEIDAEFGNLRYTIEVESFEELNRKLNQIQIREETKARKELEEKGIDPDARGNRRKWDSYAGVVKTISADHNWSPDEVNDYISQVHGHEWERPFY